MRQYEIQDLFGLDVSLGLPKTIQNELRQIPLEGSIVKRYHSLLGQRLRVASQAKAEEFLNHHLGHHSQMSNESTTVTEIKHLIVIEQDQISVSHILASETLLWSIQHGKTVGLFRKGTTSDNFRVENGLTQLAALRLEHGKTSMETCLPHVLIFVPPALVGRPNLLEVVRHHRVRSHQTRFSPLLRNPGRDWIDKGLKFRYGPQVNRRGEFRK
jgi:hypothetical protein